MIRLAMLATALVLAGCAGRYAAVAEGAGGPCDPLYRFAGQAAQNCGGTELVAFDGQAVPKPGSLARTDRDVNFLDDAINRDRAARTAAAASASPPRGAGAAAGAPQRSPALAGPPPRVAPEAAVAATLAASR